jgi:hypothetical protein
MRGYQPELPTPIVFGGGAKDERFSAVLSKQVMIVGSDVDKSLLADGDKWVAIVIVMAIHVCVGQDVGIDLQLMKTRLGILIFGSNFLDPHWKRNSDSVFDSKDSGWNFFFEFRC